MIYVQFTYNGIDLSGEGWVEKLNENDSLETLIDKCHEKFKFYDYHCIPRFAANGFKIILDEITLYEWRK